MTSPGFYGIEAQRNSAQAHMQEKHPQRFPQLLVVLRKHQKPCSSIKLYG